MKGIKVWLTTAAGGMTALLLTTTAFAAGNGYAPGQSFGDSQSGGGTLNVVTAQNVTLTGATLSATAGSASLAITVPSGAFPNGAQIVIAKGNAATVTGIPSGSKALEDFDVSFLGASGSSITPAKPITFSIKDRSIASGALVYKATANGLKKVAATVKPGEAQITFTTDPEFVLVQPGVSHATQPVTGMPFFGILAGGALFVVIGSTLLFYRRKSH